MNAGLRRKKANKGNTKLWEGGSIPSATSIEKKKRETSSSGRKKALL